MNLNRAANWFVDNVIATIPFILGWTIFWNVWMIANNAGWVNFDKPPFFRLNDVMSVWATYTLPITAMAAKWLGQRQAAAIEEARNTASEVRELAIALRDQNAMLLEMAKDMGGDVDEIRDKFDIHARLERLERDNP